MLRRIVTAAILTILSFTALAVQESCFVYAETYYEQVYCEIKQKAPATVLPSFIDFKKNNPRMQAMLLKRKAEALGITMKMPADSSKKSSANKVSISPASLAEEQPASHAQMITECRLAGALITCGNGSFLLTGNKKNGAISDSALKDQNRLKLSNFQGDESDERALRLFLTEQYTHYLEKMLEIGLGGATMSFTKFYLLFEDMSDKGADFSARFETMFQFLKKDKANMFVSEAADPISGLTMDDCARLTDKMFACDNRRRNTIYLKQ